jgi:hypothetical protein
MGRLALSGLVLMVVLGLTVGGVLAGEPRQTQEQAGPQYCYCQDGECPGCDCPGCDCPCCEALACDCPQECQQNQYGECFCWEGAPEDPWEQFLWEFQLQARDWYHFCWQGGGE